MIEVGNTYKNGYGDEFLVNDIKPGREYSVLTTKIGSTEEYSFTQEGYFQTTNPSSDMNLILEEPTVCDGEPTVCDEYCAPEETTPKFVSTSEYEEPLQSYACGIGDIEETTKEQLKYSPNANGSTTVSEIHSVHPNSCLSNKEVAVNEVVNSIIEYQLRLTNLLSISLASRASMDEVIYITTLLKDSVELKETIKNL